MNAGVNKGLNCRKRTGGESESMGESVSVNVNVNVNASFGLSRIRNHVSYRIREEFESMIR